MKEQDNDIFSSFLRERAEGFEQEPSGALFDRIQESRETDTDAFSSMLHEKAKAFELKPKERVWDGIQKRRKVDSFAEFLRKRSQTFERILSDDFFDRIQKRRFRMAAGRYIIMSSVVLLLVSILSYSTYFWVEWKHAEPETDMSVSTSITNRDKMKMESSSLSAQQKSALTATKPLDKHEDKSIISPSTDANEITIPKTSELAFTNNSKPHRHTIASHASQSEVLAASTISNTSASTSNSIKTNSIEHPNNSELNQTTNIHTNSIQENSIQIEHSENELGKSVEISSSNSLDSIHTPNKQSTLDASVTASETKANTHDAGNEHTIPISLNKEAKKWGLVISANYSLVRSKYSYDEEYDGEWMDTYLDSKKSLDESALAYRLSATLERSISKHITVSVGLGLQNLHFTDYRINQTYIDFSGTNQGGLQVNEAQYTLRKSYVSDFRYLDIPVQVQYIFPIRKCYISIQAGITYNRLIQVSGVLCKEGDTTSTYVCKSTKDKSYNTGVWYANTGVLFSMPIGTSMQFLTGPQVRYGLQSIYSNEYMITQKPVLMGWMMGIKYRF